VVKEKYVLKPVVGATGILEESFEAPEVKKVDPRVKNYVAALDRV